MGRRHRLTFQGCRGEAGRAAAQGLAPPRASCPFSPRPALQPPAPGPRCSLLPAPPPLDAARGPAGQVGGRRRRGRGAAGAPPPSCAVPEDVGSYLCAPGGPGRPGRGERPPARVPAVPRAVRAPLPAGLLPRLLRRLPARPHRRRPPRLPAVPVSASSPGRRETGPAGQGPRCWEGKALTPCGDGWERLHTACTSPPENVKAPAHFTDGVTETWGYGPRPPTESQGARAG